MENSRNTLTLDDAIDTLTALADLELESEQEINIDPSDLKAKKTIEWLSSHDMDDTVALAQGIFRTVLKHVRKELYVGKAPQPSEEAIERVKSIMQIVGIGAKKLDQLAHILHEGNETSLVDLPEYQKLQEFYEKRVARKMDSSVLSQWVLGLAQATPGGEKGLLGRVSKGTEHLYVDLEAVKKDSEYELFYLRKEDGGRYFNPRLIRNMSLVCDFGDTLQIPREEDPLLDIHEWHDRQVRSTAMMIMDRIHPNLERFYQETIVYKSEELCSLVHRCLMALMMSCNAQNYYHDGNSKSCFDYFADFLYFLRCALHSRDYQKLVVSVDTKKSIVSSALLEMIHSICYSFFIRTEGERDLLFLIQELVDKSVEDLSENYEPVEQKIWEGIGRDYTALRKMMRRHPNGHVAKILEVLDTESRSSFDPLWQYSVPCQLFTLYSDDTVIHNVRLPSPTSQEIVSQARVVEEFKAFLTAMSRRPMQQHHLIINMQDRTSWREYARCHAIEELPEIGDTSKWLTVVTMPKDTEFYWQKAPYDMDNHADVFMQNFKEQFEDDNCGFHFPESVKKKIFPKFVHQVMDETHRIFFGEKNVLTVEQRRSFIEIVYLFLELKILEVVKPNSCSIICKDSIDVSSPSNALLYLFLRMLSDEEWSAEDGSQVNDILYAQCLLQRERVLIKERFSRMLDALKVIEEARCEKDFKGFQHLIKEVYGSLFDSDILFSGVIGFK